eukprot:g56694.t1
MAVDNPIEDIFERPQKKYLGPLPCEVINSWNSLHRCKYNCFASMWLMFAVLLLAGAGKTEGVSIRAHRPSHCTSNGRCSESNQQSDERSGLSVVSVSLPPSPLALTAIDNTHTHRDKQVQGKAITGVAPLQDIEEPVQPIASKEEEEEEEEKEKLLANIVTDNEAQSRVLQASPAARSQKRNSSSQTLDTNAKDVLVGLASSNRCILLAWLVLIVIFLDYLRNATKGRVDKVGSIREPSGGNTWPVSASQQTSCSGKASGMALASHS